MLGATCCTRLTTLLRGAARCYYMLGGCWLEIENGQSFHATFVDVAWCCGCLARFVQQCCTQACDWNCLISCWISSLNYLRCWIEKISTSTTSNRSFALNILEYFSFLLPVTNIGDTNFDFLSLRNLQNNEIAFIEDGTLSVMTTFTLL